MIPQDRNREFFRAVYNFCLKAEKNRSRSEWASTTEEALTILDTFKDALAEDFIRAIYAELYRKYDNDGISAPLITERSKTLFKAVFELLNKVQNISSAYEWEQLVKTEVNTLREEYTEPLGKELIAAVTRSCLYATKEI